MKLIKITLILLFITAIFPASGFSANVLFNLGVLNNFFWRVKEDINPHVQGELEFSMKVSKDDRLGIGIIPFLSHSFDDNEVDEGNWYLYLTYKTKKIDIKGGYIYYQVMGLGEQKRPQQGEVYSSFLYKGKLGQLSCYSGLTAYFDIAKAGAAYTELVFSVDLGKSSSKVFFNVGSIVGFDFGQFVESDPQFTVLQLKLALNLRIAERIFLVPDYTYVLPLDPSRFESTGIVRLSISFR